MIMTLIGEQYIVARFNILVVRLARVRVVLGSNEQAVASEAGGEAGVIHHRNISRADRGGAQCLHLA